MSEDESFDSLLRAVARAPEVDPSTVGEADANELALVGRRLAHFRVIDRLGRGGMGCVYRAMDERLEREVALKVLLDRAPGNEDEAARAALLREAQSAASVTHRGIAQIHEVGEADGVAFIAMELVRGETLRAILARSGPLPVAEAMRVARGIAAALARAHGAGIAHLDLKPENVMVDRDGEVKVLDFGLARRVRRPAEDAHGVVRGTPAYMAPEQAAGETAGPAADVYAFGVTLHELVTGKVPAGGVLAPRVPRTLVRFVARCLEKDPGARFDGGAALDAELTSIEWSALGRRRWRRIAMVTAGLTVTGLIGAYVRERSGPPGLAPTTALRRLTANVPEVPIVHAAIAPDGARLAFADTAGLHIARIGSAETRDVALPPGGAPQIVAWAPDGLSLVVATASATEGDLLRVPLDGSGASVMAHGAFTGVAVSRDGARVAVAETRKVAWLDASGARHPLVEKPAGCAISELSWSPDGARLAYTAIPYGTLADAGIETVAAEGGPPQRIVTDPRLFNDAARAGLLWSVRGDVVYALAEWLPAESGSNLWSVPVDARTGRAAGPPRAITSWVGTGASILSEDARGERIAFVRSELQSDVYVGDLTEGGAHLSTPRRLTLSDRNERPSAWAPDGSGVYFFSDRTGNFDVFFQPLSGGPARAIAAGPTWETMPQLTPDGQALLYWSFPPAHIGEAVQPEIERRPIDGSKGPLVIARALGLSHPAGVGRPQPWEMRFRCARVATGPCVLAERDGDAIAFRALDPITGRGAELHRLEHAPSSANAWDLSPDGARLAIPRPDGTILVRNLAGGDDLVVATIPECMAFAPTWSADGQSLFLTAECASEPAFRLYSKRLDGPLALLWSDTPHFVLETEASPDGRYLAIAVKRTDNDVWAFDRP